MMKRYALFLSVLASAFTLRADHFAGGTITTRCTGNNFHDVTLQLFRNCSGAALLPQTLYFTNDCGVTFSQTLPEPVSVEDVSPLCADELANSTCNGGSLIGYDLSTFRTSVYLSPCTGWRISWSVCCRNPSLNLLGTPGMYIEATLNNLDGPCFAQPEFVRNSIPLVCIGQPVSYDGSATEPDGHTLRYDLIDARYAAPEPTAVLYTGGFSGAQPFTGMAIDSISGAITFTPTLAGTIITVVKVREYDASGALIGTVMHDLLFVASVCDNDVPSADSGTFTATTGTATIDDDRSLQVCGEGSFCASLAFADADAGQNLTITSNVADALPGATLDVTGNNPVAAELCWNSTGVAPGNYQFTITAADDACPVVGIQQYSYLVKVGAGGLAGTDSAIVVCANESEVDLLGALGGEPSPNGTWLDPNASPTSNLLDPSTAEPGDYTYTVESVSGCSSSAVVAVDIAPANDPNCINIGIAEVVGYELRLYNDAQLGQRFWIGSEVSLDVDLRVLSIDGRLIMRQRVLTNPSPTAITLQGAATGMYLVHATERNTGRQQVLRLLVR